MNASPLENPVWHSLNSYHNHLAIRGEGTARYLADILGVVSMSENGRAGFTKVRDLVETDEIVGVLGPLPEDLPGWEVVHIEQ